MKLLMLHYVNFNGHKYTVRWRLSTVQFNAALSGSLNDVFNYRGANLIHSFRAENAFLKLD